MTTQTEALKLALEALERYQVKRQDFERFADVITAIKEALAQPEQKPVAWRYKPVREDNPRWKYTTNHPLDMGDGYLRPSLVEYCKCIEPLYAKEKPKLMLEKFREMEDLLEEPAQQEPATKEQIREAMIFNLPLYTAPPQPEQEPVAYIKAAELEELKHCNGMSLWAENAAIHTEDSISKQLLPSGHVPVYTTPPQRTWVGLTLDDEVLYPYPPAKPPIYATAKNTKSVRDGYELGGYEKEAGYYSEHQLDEFAKTIEAKLKEKNT